jgi:chorismate mutase / prephenate dehydratase
MNIPDYRQAIDRLDARIVKLLNERTQLVLEIGATKLRSQQEIYAPHRELAVLERVARMTKGPLTGDSLKAIYREVMSSALSLQKTLIVAYFGPPATFTHLAAIRRFGSSLNYSPQKTIGDVFAEVSKNRADYGVVPVENSTEGVVTHTLDMFVDSSLRIVSQIVLPVQHCLVSRVRKAQIRRLYSHPQALAQCRAWLQMHLPNAEIIEASSTTRAAELAARARQGAAIASALAAQLYKLEVVEQDIQDNASNATRFLVLGRQDTPPTGRDRTSLLMSVSDRVGALHDAIAAFRRYRINMTRIESRPSKRRAWEYFFFIDIDGHITQAGVAKAVAGLEKHCSFVKVLGSYPNTD